MPELPEVETIARQLNRSLQGRVIEDIEVLRAKSFQGDQKKVLGKKIKGVSRRAKILIIELEESKHCLVIHLKMTGQLIYKLKVKSAPSLKAMAAGDEKLKVEVHNSKLGKQPNKHTRVIARLDQGALLFNDLRIFGWIKVVQSEKFKVQSEREFGVDVTDKDFTLDYLQEALGKSRRAVKLVLMDQKKMAGIGNIYANEALFCAKIKPQGEASSLKPEEVKKLHRCIRQIITKAIKYGGTTAGDDRYLNARGQPGRYQHHRLVYDRLGEPCPRCQTKIKKFKLSGRSSFFCPACQN